MMNYLHSRQALITSIFVIGILVIFNSYYWLWQPTQSSRLIEPDLISNSHASQTTIWWQSLSPWWWLGIIGVALLVIVVSGILIKRLQNAGRRQRDMMRYRDLADLQQGLEAYAATVGHYPVSARLSERTIPAVGLGYEWDRLDFPSESEIQPYLSHWPIVDPLVPYDNHAQYNQYLYYPKNQGQSFALYAHLETFDKDGQDYNNLAGLPRAWGEYNYCVEPKKEAAST